MEKKLARWMDAVTEALNDLQAARVTQAAMLDAVIMSHPDPVSLQKAWDDISSLNVSLVAQRKASSTVPRQIDQFTLEHFKGWDERLQKAFPPDQRRNRSGK